MKLKNIYTVRLINVEAVSAFSKEKAGKPTWLCVLQKDVQWSAYAVLPDLTEVDRFDLDIIFDDDFRSTNSLNAGDVFDIDFSIADKRIGIQKVEVIGIRKDRPLNHLENR
ncbi:hypothetical protein [Butyrivibrio sp. AE2032]|uniref:hypothetical protein n=1 Tax=Butyrivibrio sp. AE2032 TaxID=1458463 RepID=UPI000551F3F3|nr:hypothetical protein [Butyrivibrio sp. AE2032]